MWLKDQGTRRWLPFLCAVAIFILNVWICRELFSLEFNVHMGSIEGAYMSISRWAASNWSDLTWFPLWYTGSPFRSVYQPGLHLTVAALASTGAFTVQHAYHAVTALAWCAAPVALFFLCYGTTKSAGYGLATAVLYSLVSPACLLSSAVRAGAGGWLSLRRYQVLVETGFGPQIAALAILPLAILALHGALTLRRRVWIALAPFALAAIVLTNWPATVGLTMAILAYCISRLGAQRSLYWPALIGIGITAYLIASPWIPPSILGAVLTNAQRSDGTPLGTRHIVAAALMLAVLGGLHAVFARFDCDRVLRFFVYLALIAGAVSLSYEWFDWRLLPQPYRFLMEFDMAGAAIVAWVLVRISRTFPPRWRTALVAILLALGIAQAGICRRYARQLTRPIDIASTVEYRMARWFQENLAGQRVFAPGNVSLWMNMFSDVPQMNGCCDQDVPSIEHRIAAYTIYTGQGAGSRDVEISNLWLRVYGANAIGVTGPHSTEYYRPFANWRKFEGVLPELWRDGENVVYRVPRKSPDPVRVIPGVAVTPRAPVNGLDVEPLGPFAAALEDPALPASDFRWINRHEAWIDASTRDRDVIFLQISWDRGWRAMENGVADPIQRDPLGMMYVQPRTAGIHRIRLIYDRGGEATLTRVLQLLGFGFIAAILIGKLV